MVGLSLLIPVAPLVDDVLINVKDKLMMIRTGVASSTKKEGLSDARLRAFRQRLDEFDSNMVVWLPYGPEPASDVPRTVFTGWLRYRDVIESYMPDRVLRQFGYVQTIPMPINCLDFAHRLADSKLYKVKWNVSSVENAWTLYPRGFRLILAEFQRAQHSFDVVDGYYDCSMTFHISLLF